MITEVTIIGAGPVGLFSAFMLATLGIKSIIIDALPSIGGQCAALYPEKPIYDIPAYPKTTGLELIDNLHEQLKPFNPIFKLGKKVSNISNNNQFISTLEDNTTYTSKALILATGGGLFVPKKPPLPRIAEFEANYSVIYNIKDMFSFKNKRIIIAGGGDSAIDWALSLHDIGAQVTLVHRRDTFRAASYMQTRLFELIKAGAIILYAPYTLNQLIGEASLQEISIRNINTNEIMTLKTDILLPCYGLETQSGFASELSINYTKDYLVPVNTATMSSNISGLYAVGDIASYLGKLKLILNGFAEAATAAYDIYKFIYDKDAYFTHSTANQLFKS